MADVSMGNNNNPVCAVLGVGITLAAAVATGNGVLGVKDITKRDYLHGVLEVVNGVFYGFIFGLMNRAYKDMCSMPQGPQRHPIFEELPQVRSTDDFVGEGEGGKPRWLHKTFEHPIYSSWDDVPTEPLFGKSQWDGLAVAGALAVVLLSGGTATPAVIPALAL